MDSISSIEEIILKFNRNFKNHETPVYLTLSPALSAFSWYQNRLEMLLERFLERVIAVTRPQGGIRVALCRKKQMSDVESFFSISPAFWCHLSVDGLAEAGFENAAIEVLKDLGFHCGEWVGVEDSDSKLGAFHLEDSNAPALILFVKDVRLRRHCDFLIPVAESISLFAAGQAQSVETNLHGID
jgi:hypothetical protein